MAEQEPLLKASGSKHPFLSGNFAPITSSLPLTPCTFTGEIPQDLAGGEYIRNGANPLQNEEHTRDVHWFDGDGMLTGVLFRRSQSGEQKIVPEFVNRPVLTDLYISATTSKNRIPVIPSIRTLINPLSSLLYVTYCILRAVLLILLSHLPGSSFAIKKISVANTSVLWHDGRALATCDSGPPMRIALPGLETVGWFDGHQVEGEKPNPQSSKGKTFEWTTAHPRVDPVTQELILFHTSALPPYVNISVIPTQNKDQHIERRTHMAPLPGMTCARLMHDFAVSSQYTTILDLPLALNPLNLIHNKPVVHYDPDAPSRFGVFPRHSPQDVRWFESPAACCTFHTANSWDEISTSADGSFITAVNLLTCRLTNADLIYSAGDLPPPVRPTGDKDEPQCRLYYYRFDMASPLNNNIISHQWALSAIPFEFPTIPLSASMTDAQFIYGCTMYSSDFGAALGTADQVDCLAKIDVRALIKRGRTEAVDQITGCVDTRSVPEIVKASDPDDAIKIFRMPPGWYAQEPRFVPCKSGTVEDDGWVLTYAFDESQLDAAGQVTDACRSELWVIEAKNMKDVVARIKLPQRVPYGLHGDWFSEDMIDNQRPIESLRQMPAMVSSEGASWLWRAWMGTRDWMERSLG